MMKILIFGAALLAVATAQANENIAEFKDGFLVPVQSGAIPFVYQSALRKRFAEAEHRSLTPVVEQGVSKLSLGFGVVSAVTSMAGLPSVFAVLLLSGLVAAGPPSYLVPVEHRGISPYSSFGNVQIQPIEQLPPNTLYQYTIVPSDEVAVVAEENTDLSLIALWDCIPSLSTALTVAGSTAIAIGSWVLVKLPVILIGAALVIGLCAFTPYCTLTITKPGFLKDCQNLIPAVPSLDDIEDFAKHAFHKFNELNEVYKKK